MINFKQLFCQHEYSIQEIQKGQSESEFLLKNGLKPNTWTSFKVGVITWLICDKCRHIKVIRKSL